MRDEARDQIVQSIEELIGKKVSIIVQELSRLESNCNFIYNSSWASFFVKEAYRISLFTNNGDEDSNSAHTN